MKAGATSDPLSDDKRNSVQKVEEANKAYLSGEK
jgi:hypothetical protein